MVYIPSILMDYNISHSKSHSFGLMPEPGDYRILGWAHSI